MKRYLFIISRAPYGSNHAFEQLEAAMVAAAFNGEVHILLRDEAVWCLQIKQNSVVQLAKSYCAWPEQRKAHRAPVD